LMITNDVDEAILLADRIVPLNPGPNASLGPAFAVELDRPRSKTDLNHNETFKGLRNAVTNYLVSVRQKTRDEEAMSSEAPPIKLPDLKPKSLMLPRGPMA
ncbi:MAG: ABC transporter ATP-binding protein, partial [Planctomycetota bacterium]